MFICSFWCLWCARFVNFGTYFTPCSSISIVNFERVIVSWEDILLGNTVVGVAG